MYTTIQRFMAYVLLVGHTLMSCSNPYTGISKQELSQVEKVTLAHQEEETPTLTTLLESDNQAQEYNEAVMEDHYQCAQVQKNLEQLVCRDAAFCTGPLTTRQGHQVTFIEQEGYWWARIQENCPPGWARTLTLPVLYPQSTYLADSANLSYTVEALLSASIAIQQQAMHIVFPEQASNKQGFVYTGPAMGLLGGMKKHEKCIYKDWKQVCPSGQHTEEKGIHKDRENICSSDKHTDKHTHEDNTSAQQARGDNTSAQQVKNDINRDHGQGDFGNYRRSIHSTFSQHSQQQDFFERVKNADRRFETDLKELHLDQERRREAEHEEMRQIKEAWHKKQAKEKQQLLEQEVKEKEEQLYKEKCSLRGEAWLREEAEHKQREQEAKEKSEKEAKKKQEESQRAIEEAYRKQQEAWDQAWETPEKVHDAYVHQKEKEEQEAAKLQEIAKRRSQEKAEAFAGKLEEDIRKSIQVNIPPIPAFTHPPFLDLSRWQEEEEIKLTETPESFKAPIITSIPVKVTKRTRTREIGVESLEPIASYYSASFPSQEPVAQQKKENKAEELEDLSSFAYTPAPYTPTKRPSSQLPRVSSPTRISIPSIEELLAETGSFELDIEAEVKKIKDETQAELGALDSNNYLAPTMERILLPFALQQKVRTKLEEDKNVAQQKEEEKEEKHQEKQQLSVNLEKDNKTKTATLAKKVKTLTQQQEVPTSVSGKESEKSTSKSIADTGESTGFKIDLNNLPDRAQLEKETMTYLEACQKDTAFSKQQGEVSSIEAQLKQDPQNKDLQSTRAKLLAKLQDHPLYQQRICLGLQAAALRQKMKKKAASVDLYVLGAREMDQRATKEEPEFKLYQAEADLIKKNILEPLRASAGCLNTPPTKRKVTATLKGVGKNIVDTGKAAVDLVKFAVNVQLYMPTAYAELVMKVVQGELGIATELQEFKTSIDRGITTVKESLESFYSKAQHAWENPEEFQARLQLQAEIADYQDLYRRAFDAEGYHLEQDEHGGYWLGEILKWACGEKLLTALAQGAVKSARWVKGMGEGMKLLKEAQQGMRLEQEMLKGVEMLKGAETSVQEGTSMLKPLGLGSTGRSEPKNLIKQMAMKAAMENPQLGEIVMKEINDPRWLGWTKMRYKVETENGVKVIIHYVGKWENGVLKSVDDFKFK